MTMSGAIYGRAPQPASAPMSEAVARRYVAAADGRLGMHRADAGRWYLHYVDPPARPQYPGADAACPPIWQATVQALTHQR